MKVAAIVGARPQFVKAAVVSRALHQIPDITEVLIHTGQHYDVNMSDVFFAELAIPEPDYHLGVGSAPHGAQTGRMLEGIEQVLLAVHPDWVLVYGDTNSTLAGALAAAKLHVPVAHVEAGLRSFNRLMPEEINRVLADHASALLFAPTAAAARNLVREGIAADKIARVGDVMYDAALYYGARAASCSRILDHLALRPKGYVLATVHRAENTDNLQRLRAIVEGLALVAREWPVVFPVHPRTRAALEQSVVAEVVSEAVRLVDPLGYLDVMMLEKNAALIATDSGGMQKEAFFHKVPCATLRDETEWVELVDLGWNRLVHPTSAEAVAAGLRDCLGMHGQFGKPYGDGHAAEHIAKCLVEAGQAA